MNYSSEIENCVQLYLYWDLSIIGISQLVSQFTRVTEVTSLSAKREGESWGGV